MHEIHEELHVIHRRFRNDAVTQIEDVTGTIARFGENPPRLLGHSRAIRAISSRGARDSFARALAIPLDALAECQYCSYKVVRTTSSIHA